MNIPSNETKQEALLQSWINMSLRVRGNRLVSGLSFNEIVICRMLYNRQLVGGEPLSASDLCRRMQLLKSQINKILTSMEKQGLVERVRSQTDRRKMEIHLKPGAEKVYLEAHERIQKIMSYVYNTMGEKHAQQLTVLLQDAVRAIDSMPPLE